MNAGMERQRVSFRRGGLWCGAAALMLLPVIALRGIDRTQWDLPGDLMFLVILLTGLGFAYELAARVRDRSAYRAGAAVAVGAALLGAWINLAVGIVGSEDNPANWIYAGPPAVAAAGSVFARLRPLGMGWAMAAAAAAQVAAFLVALAAGLGFTGPITVFFAGLWLIAAWLFARAAGEAEAR